MQIGRTLTSQTSLKLTAIVGISTQTNIFAVLINKSAEDQMNDCKKQNRKKTKWQNCTFPTNVTLLKDHRLWKLLIFISSTELIIDVSGWHDDCSVLLGRMFWFSAATRALMKSNNGAMLPEIARDEVIHFHETFLAFWGHLWFVQWTQQTAHHPADYK